MSEKYVEFRVGLELKRCQFANKVASTHAKDKFINFIKESPSNLSANNIDIPK